MPHRPSDPYTFDTPWRRTAVAIFNRASSADTICPFDLDVTATQAFIAETRREGQRWTLTHFLLAAIARALAEDAPELNTYLRRGRIRQRPQLDLSVAVGIPNSDGIVDAKIPQANTLSVPEIADQLRAEVARYQGADGARLVAEKHALGRVPWPFRTWLYGLVGWWVYDLGFRLGWLSAEDQSSLFVSNAAPFQLPFAAVPLSISGKVAHALVIGTAAERPVVRAGEIVIRTMLTICLTADHRLADGLQIGRFFQGIDARLQEPAALCQAGGTPFGRESGLMPSGHEPGLMPSGHEPGLMPSGHEPGLMPSGHEPGSRRDEEAEERRENLR